MRQEREAQKSKILCCRYLVALLAARLRGKRAKRLPAELTWRQVYEEARRQNVESMAFYAAKAQLRAEPELLREWGKRREQNLVQSMMQLGERDLVIAGLTEAGIRVLPMKGSVIKEFYPEIDDRQMSDLDFLIDDANMEPAGAVMAELGYEKVQNEADYHDEYEKGSYMTVELHRNMLTMWHYTHKYFDNIWEKVVPEGKTSGCFRLTPEDEYLYQLAHFERHYTTEGSGIRPVMDIAVYQKHFAGKLDRGYIETELKKLGIEQFAHTAERLAAFWFGAEWFEPERKDGTTAGRDCGKPVHGRMNREMRAMALALFYGGTYGSRLGKVLVTVGGKSGEDRGKYLLKRIFVSQKFLGHSYPVLRKYPVLYPFCWLHRLAVLCLFKRGRVAEEMELLR